jgi:hypothetical protein
MKHITIILICALFLVACAKSADKPANEAYAQDEVYQGYPCIPDCQAFQKGFDNAKNQGLTQPNQCSGENMAEITGCKAYVNEYQFENQTYEDLVNHL